MKRRRFNNSASGTLAGQLLLWLLCSHAGAMEVRDVPRPADGEWVVDTTGTLSTDARREVNAIGDRVRVSANAPELVVVLIGSTNGWPHQQFATELFNRWGIGSTDYDNGALLFVALEDRRVEIILGEGIDANRQVRIARNIVAQQRPFFRRGDVNGAVLLGANGIADQILEVRFLSPDDVVKGRARRPGGHVDLAADRQRNGGSSVVFQPVAPRRTRIPAVAILAAFVGVVALAIFGYRKHSRYRARQCVQCGFDMVLLGEEEDDYELTYEEQLEESLGSVDYDVWACRECNEALKLRYGALFTKYSICPVCDRRTKSRAETTVRAASYSSGGLVRVDETCVNCDYANSHTYVTPRLERPRSSRRAGSFGSGGSFGGGGRSFGGGRSSGRGAGGSW